MTGPRAFRIQTVRRFSLFVGYILGYWDRKPA